DVSSKVSESIIGTGYEADILGEEGEGVRIRKSRLMIPEDAGKEAIEGQIPSEVEAQATAAEMAAEKVETAS
ncbi:MAG TPA: hypothetical protein DCL81_21160, partial [Algoriphagus sp.]|nr:hypothetical protein [Algoriphagus sp.]